MTHNLKKTLWISHRGYKEKYLENTLEAFEEAVQQGFTVLETDLRTTKDGQVVLSHDPTLMRLAGINRDVHCLTRAELEQVKLPNGQKLLFLDVFLRKFHGCTWIFDVKREHGDNTLNFLHAWSKQQRLEKILSEKARFLVWCNRDEKLLNALFPNCFRYAGKKECLHAALKALTGIPFLGPIKPGMTYSLISALGPLEFFTKPVVDHYHQRQAKVLAFLPRKKKEVIKALELGFDELLTDGGILPHPG